MELTIAICDDDPSDLKKISTLLTSCSIKLDMDLNISRFDNSEKLLDTIKPNTPFPYHLIFLDIKMPGDNGLSLARTLNRCIPPDTLIIFVSCYASYMSESFSVHPFDFLQKPVTSAQIMRLLTDVKERYEKRSNSLMIVAKNGIDTSIHLDEILYVQSQNSKLQHLILHTADDFYLKNGTLSDLAARYPNLFVSANRTTLISLIYVHYVTDREVILINGTKLPISIRNRRNLLRILKSNPNIQY